MPWSADPAGGSCTLLMGGWGGCGAVVHTPDCWLLTCTASRRSDPDLLLCPETQKPRELLRSGQRMAETPVAFLLHYLYFPFW